MHTLDHALEKLEPEIQEEQVREVGSPQAPSVRVLTLFVIKASPDAFHQYFLSFLLNHYLYSKFDCALSL
jgi:hypothetical protein